MSSRADLMTAVEPDIARLIDDHHSRREHWYAHEVVPWELGRSYRDDPWDESQATLAPEARTALVLNLLTEDNLPYYHLRLATAFAPDSAMTAWSKTWTAEEGQHAIAMRSYLLASRNCDPRALEDDRVQTVTKGWSNDFVDPIEVFVYTSAQELATRISHRNAGKLADDEIAYEVMSRVAADENHHFMFYRGVVTAMLEHDPSAVVTGMWRVFDEFEMPGTGIPKYLRRAIAMAKAGVYNLRIHADRVVSPLLRDWRIEELEGLDPAADQARDKLMALPAKLLESAEAFEKRVGMTPSPV
ncbi:MAG: acyl-ACP desaturase [Acidimicrobiales bacterium]